MRPEHDYSRQFKFLTDEALTEIAFGPDPDAYETAAIAAALAELRERRASAHGLKDRVVENNRIIFAEIDRADAPNEWWRRILTFFAALTFVIPWVMAGRLEAKGYFRKATDTRWWWLNSVLFWFGLIFIYNEVF